MSKWYEVVLKFSKVLAVEVKDEENEEDALQVAADEYYDAEEIEAVLMSRPNRIDSLRRHADEEFPLEE